MKLAKPLSSGTEWVQSGNEDSGRTRVALLGNRHDDRLAGRLLPRPGGPIRRGGAVHDDGRDAALERGRDRPDGIVRVERGWRDGIPCGEVAGGGQRQGLPLGRDEVGERERKLAGVLTERASQGLPHAVDRLVRGQAGAEFAQQREPARPDDAVGFLGHHAEHAGNPAVVLVQRAVREGVVGLFREAAALEEQPQPFIPGGLAGGQDVLDPGTDVRPDLCPHLAGGPAQGPRVFGSQRHPGVGVVVEERQLRSPAHPHRVAGREHHADDRADARRP